MKVRAICKRLGDFTALGVLALFLAGTAAGATPAVPAGPPRGDAPDLAAVHNGTSLSSKKNCLGCHGDIMKRITLDKKIKDAHAAMVPFAPGYDSKKGVTNDTCVSCHAQSDFVQQSAAQIRRNVSVEACVACHGKSGPASRKFYAN